MSDAGTSTTFAIRRATLDDAPFVVELSALPHVAAHTLGPRDRATFERALARDAATLLVLERDGEPFGHAYYAVVDDWLMEIRFIAVRVPRLGGGRLLVNHLVSIAFEELRLRRISLEVVASNAVAIALYESLGFVREGRYRDGYRGRDGRFEDLLPYGKLASDRLERMSM